jgi:AcrR family transcriptional regulator|tara:strand:+ start:17417 stop:18091 length:675 start_codon:yes stop_codon:yes gene_type:complete
VSLPAESKRDLAKAQTRRALLKSALHLYSQEGAQGMSMNKVAKGAGIAQPSFYNHFASLDALQSELSEQLKDNYLSSMRMAWVSMLKDYDALTKEDFNQRCEQCLNMIFDSAFQNINLFQRLIEDRPRLTSALNNNTQSLGNLITQIQSEWTEIFIQGLMLSGRTFEHSDVNLGVDMATAQVHELILGCHQKRYSREQAIAILCTTFDGLFMNLFVRKVLDNTQ